MSPPDRVQPWNEDTFERLVRGRPRPWCPLRHHARADARGAAQGAPDPDPPVPWLRPFDLLEESHLEPHGSASFGPAPPRCFGGCGERACCRSWPDPKTAPQGGGARPGAARRPVAHPRAQRVAGEAQALLDETDPDHAFNVLSVVESVADDPYPILRARPSARRAPESQTSRPRAWTTRTGWRRSRRSPGPSPQGLALGGLRALVGGPPWVQGRGPRPKSIVREMAERQATFAEYVGELGLGAPRVSSFGTSPRSGACWPGACRSLPVPSLWLRSSAGFVGFLPTPMTPW